MKANHLLSYMWLNSEPLPFGAHSNFHEKHIMSFLRTILFSHTLAEPAKPISIAELLAEAGMHKWIETNDDNQVLPDETGDMIKLSTPQLAGLQALTRLTTNKIKISKTSIGLAAYAHTSLESGTWMLYAGVVYTSSFDEFEKLSLADSAYSFCLYASPNKQIVTWLNARYEGNVTRFFQHAPQKKFLDNFSFNPPELKESVACANVLARPMLTAEDKRLVIFETQRGIEADEILVVDYNPGYWRTQNIAPLFLKKDGTVIDPACYQPIIPAKVRFQITTTDGMVFSKIFSGEKVKSIIAVGAEFMAYQDSTLIIKGDDISYKLRIDPTYIEIEASVIPTRELPGHGRVAQLYIENFFKRALDSKQSSPTNDAEIGLKLQ
jgi:hypothetical protein